jgi:hypothetical protein
VRAPTRIVSTKHIRNWLFFTLAAAALTAATPAPTVRVRLDHTVSTKQHNPGDRFTATLSRPAVVHGMNLPTGTRFRGHLVAADSSGRLTGRAVMRLTLDSFTLNGKEHRIRTSTIQRVSADHKKRNAVAIGGTSGLGAAIGAIAGGGTGAAIGAGAGAAAGTAGAYATGKREVTLPAETPLLFTVR